MASSILICSSFRPVLVHAQVSKFGAEREFFSKLLDREQAERRAQSVMS